MKLLSPTLSKIKFCCKMRKVRVEVSVLRYLIPFGMNDCDGSKWLC